MIARIFFVLLTTWCAMMLAEPETRILIWGGREATLFGLVLYERLLFSILGFSAAMVILLVEIGTNAISSHTSLMAALGMFLGLIFANFFAATIPNSVATPGTARLVCSLMFGYFGMILAIKHADRFHLSRLKFLISNPHDRPKVLDSSVIIDGRVRELIDLRVVQGQILVPNFVLREIQAIADSSDPNRKARGRRGLEMLSGLRDTSPDLELVDKDYQHIPEVDQKLVQLCRELDADLVTNDFNLQKIARFHKITVLNLNEIASALKPTVYIGEMFDLTIMREGKERGQGIGYLEDGTMVVVDDAANLIGQELSVLVSSILQTSSGRLVFARMRDREDLHYTPPQRQRA